MTKTVSISSEYGGIGSTKETDFNLLSNIIKRDALWTNLVLEVIGLMCDGQNRTLQDYLREQLDNFKVSEHFKHIITNLNYYNFLDY